MDADRESGDNTKDIEVGVDTDNAHPSYHADVDRDSPSETSSTSEAISLTHMDSGLLSGSSCSQSESGPANTQELYGPTESSQTDKGIGSRQGTFSTSSSKHSTDLYSADDSAAAQPSETTLDSPKAVAEKSTTNPNDPTRVVITAEPERKNDSESPFSANISETTVDASVRYCRELSTTEVERPMPASSGSVVVPMELISEPNPHEGFQIAIDLEGAQSYALQQALEEHSVNEPQEIHPPSNFNSESNSAAFFNSGNLSPSKYVERSNKFEKEAKMESAFEKCDGPPPVQLPQRGDAELDTMVDDCDGPFFSEHLQHLHLPSYVKSLAQPDVIPPAAEAIEMEELVPPAPAQPGYIGEPPEDGDNNEDEVIPLDAEHIPDNEAEDIPVPMGPVYERRPIDRTWIWSMSIFGIVFLVVLVALCTVEERHWKSILGMAMVILVLIPIVALIVIYYFISRYMALPSRARTAVL